MNAEGLTVSSISERETQLVSKDQQTAYAVLPLADHDEGEGGASMPPPRVRLSLSLEEKIWGGKQV